ncbi:MAG: class I SAM-dependent methyltransferase [Chitinophagaceae bacterium]|nr:class I SAM-dependent methyltransferase [Chitinophagaceae bacterium]
MDKVSQAYWDNSYSGYRYSIANDEVTKWLDKCIHDKKGTAFEAGCYPGRYLAYLGKKGWQVSGMDLTPRMESDFKEWLLKNDITFGKIEKGDVLEYMKAGNDKYDLVCSFGFIEHFENFTEIIALHDRILTPNGKLIITTPHFRGAVQRFLHSWLDKENLNRHYIPSMNPSLWKKQLESMGYTVIWSGYFGNFDFWADRQKRNLFNKISLKIIYKLTSLLRWLPDSRLYSPYCGIVAEKKQS